MPKKKVIRFRGREKKVDAIYIDDKFVAVKGYGIAKRFRRRR